MRTARSRTAPAPAKYDGLVNAARANGYDVTFTEFDDGSSLLDIERDGNLLYLRLAPGHPAQARHYSRPEGWDVRVSIAEIERRVFATQTETSGTGDGSVSA